MLNTCADCQAGSNRFNFDRRCCRVRYLLRLRDKAAREGWIGRFGLRYGEDAAKKDKRLGRQIYGLVGQVGFHAAMQRAENCETGVL